METQDLNSSFIQNEFEAKYNKLLSEGYEFKYADYIKKGFDIFKKNPGNFIAFILVMFVINLGLGLIPVAGSIAALLINPCMYAGLILVARKMDRGESTEFGDFFSGFNYFTQLFVGSLIVGIFVAIGMIFLVIPGIYLAVAWSFFSLFIIFANKEFWPAMEYSRKLINKEWFAFLGFFIILILINLAGAICLGVGLLVTIPATLIAVFAAYDDIVGA
jgi:uncharacterized membrane protein